MSDSAILWTVARQALLSMGFSGREHWSGLSFPFLGDLPNLEIESGSPALQADSLLSELPGKSSPAFLGDRISEKTKMATRVFITVIPDL